MRRYLVWVSGTPASTGREIMAASSFEARRICAAAWKIDLSRLAARAISSAQPAGAPSA